MENYLDFSMEDEQMEIPPGFRFHPTDEELITHYLSNKVVHNNFNSIAIGEVDFNKVEPWDLPRKVKMGVKEWYFFCMKDRKYPTGLRTNRATETGYWKATGKDKEIYNAKSLIGMRKTLVFYTGRAPRGEKTTWVMHEYRLDGKYLKLNFSKPSKNEWVLSRVFDKGSSEKKLNHSGLLPPLMDSSSPNNNETEAPITMNSLHVACFDHPCVVEDPNATSTTRTNTSGDHFGTLNTTSVTNPCSSSLIASKLSVENSLMDDSMDDFQYIDSFFEQDESVLRLLLDGKYSKMSGSSKVELSQGSGLSVGDINYDVSNFAQMDQNLGGHGPVDLDCLWDY